MSLGMRLHIGLFLPSLIQLHAVQYGTTSNGEQGGVGGEQYCVVLYIVLFLAPRCLFSQQMRQFLLVILFKPSEIIPVHCNAVMEWRRVVELTQNSTVSMQWYKLIPLQLDRLHHGGWVDVWASCDHHVTFMGQSCDHHGTIM